MKTNMNATRILTVCMAAMLLAGGNASAAPAPALEKDDLFAPYAKGVPKVTTVISEETKDGVKVTKLRFASAEGSKEGEVMDCEIYDIMARPANSGEEPAKQATRGSTGSERQP